jgi:hypothetical protein
MDNRNGLLLCSAAALLVFIGHEQAQASPSPAPASAPRSYADLLDPIPNAVDALKAEDAARSTPQDRTKLAQLYFGFDDGPYYHHHHHHHHHHQWRGYGGGYYAPDCYWTRGAPYWNGYGWVRERVRVCR